MLVGQLLEIATDAALFSVFTESSIAARIAANDLIIAWRECGERRRCPRSLVGWLVPHLGEHSAAKQAWPMPVGLKDIEELLVKPGAAEWQAPPLGQYRPLLLNPDKYNRRPWFGQLAHQSVKGGYIDAETAIKRFYEGESGAPKLRGKSRRLAFRVDNGVGTVRVEGKLLYLPAKAGGVVKLKEGLRWPGKVIRECRIRQQGGRWYAAVKVEITPEEYGVKCGVGTIGIDLGLRTFATIARPGDSQETVEKVAGPEPLKRALAGLRRKQRRLARRKPGSKNRQKAKAAVARQHGRIDCIRKDFLHKLSHKLTAEAEIIQVESLTVKGWQQLWGRKTSDLAPGEFLR